MVVHTCQKQASITYKQMFKSTVQRSTLWASVYSFHPNPNYISLVLWGEKLDGFIPQRGLRDTLVYVVCCSSTKFSFSFFFVTFRRFKQNLITFVAQESDLEAWLFISMYIKFLSSWFLKNSFVEFFITDMIKNLNFVDGGQYVLDVK